MMANASLFEFDISPMRVINSWKFWNRTVMEGKICWIRFQIQTRSLFSSCLKRWRISTEPAMLWTAVDTLSRLPRHFNPVYSHVKTRQNWLHQMFGIFLGTKSVSLFRSSVVSRHLHYSRSLSSQIGEIMKLYSDRGNPFLLRILAAKNLAGVPLTVQYINYEGKV